MRRIVTTLCLVLCALWLQALTAGPAAAHTGLLSSEPASGQVLPRLPAKVALTFRQPVTAGADAVRVFDDHMRRMDLGGHPDDRSRRTLRTALPGSLRAGTYTVAWQVTSPDGHPVAGRYRFSIGTATQVVGVVPSLAGANGAWAGRLLGAARGIGYAGLALGPGVLLVALWLWPAGLRDRRTRVLLWAGLGLLAAGTLAVLTVHTVWADGRPLAEAWSGSDAHQHAVTADLAYAVRFYSLLALGAATAVATASAGRDRPARPLVLATTAAAVVLWGTWPTTGHAVDGRYAPLAVAVDLLHLAAMTLWLGGLALVAAVLSRPAHSGELTAVLPRFSRLAFTAVVVLVVTGTCQAWREVGSAGHLLDTPFGRLLLLKSAGVATIVALGGLARRWVRRHATRPATLPPAALDKAVDTAGGAAVDTAGGAPAGPAVTTLTLTAPAPPAPPDAALVRTLRRGLLAELLVAALVLGVTAALVTAAPPA
ncbi:copper resistance CopC/CopD family protein [Streptomyces sp. NPDC056738]|uniref:copper resistance CopC/CopD family protein n=1 Tax=Streptomyces sp. NPDC056738 TaxID=3345933 RepID=UPI00368DD173